MQDAKTGNKTKANIQKSQPKFKESKKKIKLI